MIVKLIILEALAFVFSIFIAEGLYWLVQLFMMFARSVQKWFKALTA